MGRQTQKTGNPAQGQRDRSKPGEQSFQAWAGAGCLQEEGARGKREQSFTQPTAFNHTEQSIKTD